MERIEQQKLHTYNKRLGVDLGGSGFKPRQCWDSITTFTTNQTLLSSKNVSNEALMRVRKRKVIDI
jgi:hypothetical protein